METHIITVGTSLLTNDGHQRNKRNNQINEVNGLNDKCNKIEEAIIIGQSPTANDITEVVQLLSQLNPENEINLRPPDIRQPKGTDRLPQELSYLWIRKRNELRTKPEFPELVYLLPSGTPDSRFCAEVVKRYINKHAELNKYFKAVDICPVEGINAFEGIQFREQGVKNLFEVVYKLINLLSEQYKIYLNITGGYKGIVPYTTLQGMLHPSGKVTICYLFESSQEIIKIPSYPIGVDFHLWHRNAVRLKMICEYGIACFKEKNLDPKIKELIKDNNLDALGKQLEQKYIEQSKEQPLEIYSKEIIRIILYGDSNASEYIKILEGIINKAGVNIWTGDKIPEMVEHARRHHHNLLEFAEMFLSPIFAENNTFLNIKERFCLIAAILLHDCGHSIDYMDTGMDRFGLVPLFPGEIRKYHHLLAPRRLEDPDLGKTIGWVKKEYLKETGIDEKLHDAVMTVCRYHRRSTPFNDNEKEFRNPFTEETFPPLIKYRNNFKDIGVDIMKVAGMIRLIDGCDNQASRTGTKEDVEITLELLKKDYESTHKRAEETLEAYKHVCIAIKDNTDDELKEGCNYIDYINMKLKDAYMDFRIKCLETLENTKNEGDKTLARLWLAAAELVDRADMKHKQDEHYLKHQCVERVMVIPSGNFNSNDNFEFNIVLYKNDEIAEEYLDNERKAFIEDELKSEYSAIEEYLLNECKLRIRYWWEEGYKEMNSGGQPFYEYHG